MIEIERKFLLEGLPKKKADDKIFIRQYYLENENGVWERARICHYEKENKFKYIHTVKTSLEKGVNEEVEKELTLNDFESFLEKWEAKSNSRWINKVRHIYKHGDLKWEVDQFLSGMSLVVAEIELPTKKYKLKVPKYISDMLLVEVTGIKKFSNKNLSKQKNGNKKQLC